MFWPEVLKAYDSIHVLESRASLIQSSHGVSGAACISSAVPVSAPRGPGCEHERFPRPLVVSAARSKVCFLTEFPWAHS